MDVVPTVETIINSTARHFGIPNSVLSDKTIKTHPVSFARHIAMYIARRKTFQSYMRVGKAFGMTHAAVLKGEKNIEKISSLPETKKHIQSILNSLK